MLSTTEPTLRPLFLWFLSGFCLHLFSVSYERQKVCFLQSLFILQNCCANQSLFPLGKFMSRYLTGKLELNSARRAGLRIEFWHHLLGHGDFTKSVDSGAGESAQ